MEQLTKYHRCLRTDAASNAYGTLPWLRDYPNIGFRCPPALGVGLAGILVRNGAGDDDVLTVPPVHWRRHLVLGGELQGVNDAQHLVEVSPGGHGIDQDQFDLLVRANDKDVAYGLIIRRRTLGRITRNRSWQHPI